MKVKVFRLVNIKEDYICASIINWLGVERFYPDSDSISVSALVDKYAPPHYYTVVKTEPEEDVPTKGEYIGTYGGYYYWAVRLETRGKVKVHNYDELAAALAALVGKKAAYV